MALTNPNKGIKLAQLSTFKTYLDGLFQTQAIEVEGITAATVEGALEELAGSIAALPSAIVPKGTKTFEQLAPSTDLAAANVGFMWNISNAFTTTADFVEGAGKSIPAGANVYVANPSSGVYKYDVFQGMVDLSGYKTVQTAVTDPTASGNATSFIATISQDTNGEITVTKKTIPTVSASTGGTGGNDGLMTAAQAEKLGALPTNSELTTALGGKADKVTSATNGNFAGLDANGNLTDSGSKASDFATAAQGAKADTAIQSVAEGSANGTISVDGTDVDVHGLGSAAYEDSSAFQAAGDYKTTQEAVSSPSTGSATDAYEFIATISQNTNGVISATKQAVRSASASQSGLMSAAHYSKLDAIDWASDSDIAEIFAEAE